MLLPQHSPSLDSDKIQEAEEEEEEEEETPHHQTLEEEEEAVAEEAEEQEGPQQLPQRIHSKAPTVR